MLPGEPSRSESYVFNYFKIWYINACNAHSLYPLSTVTVVIRTMNCRGLEREAVANTLEDFIICQKSCLCSKWFYKVVLFSCRNYDIQTQRILETWPS